MIVVIHNDVTSNRLNPATQTVLKMIGEKFEKADTCALAALDPHLLWITTRPKSPTSLVPLTTPP